ncbi:hypothetical protein [Amycolatopsis granulosa]|uniref:hypothetical protein n=1 Tax=Amycolatopsis granulosa TaxID=185684 RepID=UPI0014213EB4|nr:hypothetical protein [Amycolatopsis granulosa]NIH87092.1 hypothetical protein [Amycolatopsis granulosa]
MLVIDVWTHNSPKGPIMKLRKALLTAGTIAATATAVLAGTTTASATTDPPPPGGWDFIFSTSGATLYVKKHGDILKICDTNADNKYARVDVYEVEKNGKVDPKYDLVNGDFVQGLGNCHTHRASQGWAWDLREGQQYEVHVSGNSNWTHKTWRFTNDH